MLTSDAPGEVRKASAIAMRLAQLGALRGDRRAGGEGLVLPLHATELSTPQGKRALNTLLESMEEQEQCAVALRRLGFFFETGEKGETDPKRFLNRLMGAPLALQDELLRRLVDAMNNEAQAMADQGILPQLGVHRLVGTRVAAPTQPILIFGQKGRGEVLLHEASFDLAVTYEAVRARDFAAKDQGGFYLQRPADGHAVDGVARRRALFVMKRWTPIRRPPPFRFIGPALAPHLPRVRVLFPNGQEHEWDLDKLENDYEWHEPDDVSVASAWEMELGDVKVRSRGSRVVHVLTGSLLGQLNELKFYLSTPRIPGNDNDGSKLPEIFNMRIVKLPMHNGPELIGLLVPPGKVAALRNIAIK